MTGQVMNNRETYKILFLSLNTRHAVTVSQVLVRDTQTYYLLLMSSLALLHTQMILLKPYAG